jgi:hypothetical protein
MRQLTGPRNPGRKRGLRKINRRVLTGELTTYASWLPWFGGTAGDLPPLAAWPVGVSSG